MRIILIAYVTTLLALSASLLENKESISEYRSGEIIQDCDECPEMVMVPGGDFMFGSPENEPLRMAVEEGPQYAATVSGLLVSKTEITKSHWSSCIERGFCLNPTAQQIEYSNFPMVDVSWEDINTEKGFIDWLNHESQSEQYRLPTEIEWEYFARAGVTTAFPRKYKILSTEANFRGTAKYAGRPASDYLGRAIEVATFKPNNFGLYDVQGNALEWTHDCWFETLTDYKLKQFENCNRKGLRGGSWLDEPNSLRFAFRRGYDKNTRTKNIGFRVVKILSKNANMPRSTADIIHIIDFADVEKLNRLGQQGCRLVEVDQNVGRFRDCGNK